MFKLVKVIITFLFYLISVSGFGQDGEIATPYQYPRLVQAHVPFYPGIAEALQFGGRVEIDVTVEDGIITETKVKSETIEPPNGREKEFQSNTKLLQFLTVPSLENLKTWRFVQGENGRFTVTFIYKIEGEETLYPENHKIELDLPLTVKITAKPSKPQKSP